MPDETISRIYQRRFSATHERREAVWQVLVRHYFQKFVPNGATVLEIAAGYCHFINNIRAARKIALDINPDVSKYANDDVETVLAKSNAIPLPDHSVDVVFVSNFFEHISKQEIIQTLEACKRVLKIGGSLIVLQPNIRYCKEDYWMYFDHITPLDDRCLVEAIQSAGMRVTKSIPRFLPYTMKSRLPSWPFAVKLYLMLPLLQRLMGKQSLIVADNQPLEV